ncbi:HD domain-containing protein [Terrilactibacillus sp. BCM23-1]|uniref:HD domain-containing protein n=1 Tax=Terrilactibacillus tamarindi TaxID=2599694 RepID=A0A6N8CR35_9BACI|nr:HD domain-containing phosphohydrolase [Terrilactibacillus tamarindi]MTT31543.1 HD domain-containing protein [Terrilactibacillus tamarindi]
MSQIQTSQLIEGMFLSKDVFINSTVLFKAGTLVTSAIIEELNQLGIETVTIDKERPILKYEGLHHRSTTDARGFALSEEFSQHFSLIANELRYGRALNAENTYQWIKSLYIYLLSDPTVAQLVRDLKQWNFYTFNHSLDVFVLGALLAKKSNMKNVETFALGCLLHDIGKMYTPRTLLDKKGKLTEHEYGIIKHHPVDGANMLEKLDFPQTVVKLARSHHERLDQSGYPYHASASELDKDVRIIMIIDVYSALTLNRSYRKPVPATQALEIILKDSDKQYDVNQCYDLINLLRLYPQMTEVILSDGRQGTITYDNGSSEMLPIVKLKDNNKIIQLPRNLSTTISSVIGWKKSFVKEKGKQNWFDFIFSLINNTRMETLRLFDILSDSKRVEDIYSDIIERAMNEIQHAVDKNQILKADQLVAMYSLIHLLDIKMVDFIGTIRQENAVIVANIEGLNNRLPLRMVNDLIEINGMKTKYLGEVDQLEDIIQLMKVKNLHTLALSLTKEESILPMKQHVMKLIKFDPHIRILVHGQKSKYLRETFSHLKNVVLTENIPGFICVLNNNTLFNNVDQYKKTGSSSRHH